LWQVIYKIPAYVGSIRDVFTDAVNMIVSVDGFTEILQNFITDNHMARVRLILTEDGVATRESVIDFLYSLSPAQWKIFSEMDVFSSFSSVLESTAAKLAHLQNFFGLNIAEQPMYYIKNALAGGAIALAIIALLIPILSWATQMLNIKLMPQPAAQGDGNDGVSSSMKTMNTFMPLMSAVFCFTFPVGLGIYWISSAVVRSIQMVVINKQLDKINVDELVEKNLKKAEEKRTKQGLPPQKITSQAHQTARNINTAKNVKGVSGTASDHSQKIEQAYENSKSARPGSITAKANMVRDFDERNKKK
jgi:YidC/Oxa1 family membrane protein insertase